MPIFRRLAAAILLLLLLASRGSAQVDRYDLGRRVRAFEAAWDRRPDDAARRRTTGPLAKAVGAFFSLRFGEAGRALVEARHLLDSPEGPGPAVLWAESLDLRPAKRLVEAGTATLPATLVPSYAVAGFEPPRSARVVAILETRDGPRTVLDERIFPPPGAARPPTLDLKDAPPGDRTLRVRIVDEGRVLAESALGLSIVADLAPRLAALEAAVAGWPEEAKATTDRETARALVALIASIAGGPVRETDYPLDRLTAEAEALLASLASARPFYGPGRPAGQFWLTLALGSGRTASVRIQVPAEAGAGPRPLVLALHGAGGSENMFFDAYGDGAIARLCRDRGWFLVAPRGNGMGTAQIEQIVDEIARLYPADAARVVVVGHSMGAMQAVAAGVQSPRRYRAVAALGGGGRIADSDGLADLPFFVGIGDRDFALGGARSLNAALKQANVKVVDYREYPAIEHLAIVQAALPDVFAFFEKSLGGGH